MSRVYHRAVGASILALMNDFLRTYFRHVDQSSATYVSAELDLAFLRYWLEAYREHREELACAQCEDFQDCATGDALAALRPDPLTGASDRFRRYVLALGTYDLVSHHGEIHLDLLRDRGSS